MRLPGMILTWVYASDRESYTEWLCRFVEERGAKVHLVHLHCDSVTLEQRVMDTSRGEFNKLTSVDGLRNKLAQLSKPFSQVTTRPGLSLSTQALPPEAAAREIVRHFALVEGVS